MYASLRKGAMEIERGFTDLGEKWSMEKCIRPVFHGKERTHKVAHIHTHNRICPPPPIIGKLFLMHSDVCALDQNLKNSGLKTMKV